MSAVSVPTQSTSLPSSAAGTSKRTYDDLIQTLGKEGHPQRKKARKGDTCDVLDPYVLAGKAMPRCIHPFLRIAAVMHIGTMPESDRASAEGAPGTLRMSEQVIREEKIHLDAFRALINRVPGFPETIQHFRDAKFPANWKNFIAVITHSAATVRANDTTGLKHKTDYILKDPSTEHVIPVLKGSSKSDRGFSHAMLARLLCPQKHLETLDDDPSFVEKLKDGRVKVKACDWPAFVYADGVYDPADLDKGLMRGSVLLRVFRHIFTGPATALKPTSDRNTTCNAAILNITRVTPEMIGYAAIQARFMMGTQEKWTQFDGLFDMGVFYSRIVNLFKIADEDWIVETLAWWQSQVFGSSGTEEEDIWSTDVELESDDIIQERQRRARHEAKRAPAAATLASLPQGP